MIKLIASDLDGTIIDSNNNIYKNNLKAMDDINKKKIDFVICTGKTYPIIKDMCSKFNATFGIFGNGNQIIDLRTGKEIYKNLLNKHEVTTCIDFAKEKNLHIHIYTDNEIITEKLEYMDLRNYELQERNSFGNSLNFKIVPDIKNYITKNNVSVCKLIISDINSLDSLKQTIIDSLDISIISIKKYGKYKDTVIDKEYEYLDITPNGIDKNNALDILRTYLNISENEVLAIGDNLNDLSMIKNSGIGVAMNNAYDEIKKIANYTTVNPVEKGGFAEAIYKFIEF